MYEFVEQILDIAFLSDASTISLSEYIINAGEGSGLKTCPFPSPTVSKVGLSDLKNTEGDWELLCDGEDVDD